ncbi:restriction endonuclease subunit S [Corynebacterium diphtheriae]|uniref:restriction endonuclease subunit S n=1 Tax=Corynebacterium diphtheriae TaxID=1717 RepID=UPI0018C97B61|nr:restriction endonuclease subunit S [Corynebacterium diphtheriae]
MTKRRTPALRFDGFDGEWAYTRLADIAHMYQPQTVASKELQQSGVPVFGANGYIGFYHKANHVSDQVTISARGENSGTPSYVVGPVWITGNSMVVNVDRSGIDKRFLYGNLSSRSLKSLVTGGAQPQLTRVVLNEFQIPLPSTPQEQRAIGELFADLDALIEQRRAKHASLQKTKTALMQRMFPQDGADEPELQLGGFSGAWEPRIMRDCAEYSKGNGYSKKDIADEGTPVIHYGRLYTNYETVITDVDTFAFPQPGALISRGDEVLIPASGETAEDIAIASALLQSGVLIGGDLNVIRPRQNIDPVFLALSLSDGMAKETLVKRAQGKSVVHLRNSDIQEVEILFPSLEEQRAIGEVFTNLDALIAAEHRYIAQLTQAKTALLQRMFV